MSQQPPEPPPPSGSGGPPPPRKKRHGVPNRGILLGIGVLGIGTFIVIIGSTLGRGGGVGYSGSPPIASASSASASSADAAAGGDSGPPTTSPQTPQTPPTAVQFVIAGYSSSGGLKISYGSNRNVHAAHLPHINGTVTYSVPFDPNAQYYAVNAQIVREGHLTCEIVVIGQPPAKPLTVSRGSASGGGAICSARAAPSDSSGLAWQNEH
jgi:hypothetical protein